MSLAWSLVLLGAGARTAWANPTLIMLAPRDKPKVSQTLREAVKAQLSDVKLQFRVQPVDSLPIRADCRLASARALVGRPGVAAVFWFETQTSRVCLLFSPDRGGRLVNRRVSGSGEEGRYEAVAVLVRTAVRTGQAPQRPTTRGPRGARELLPVRPLTRPGMARLDLELAYGVEIIAPGAVPLAHGLRLAAGVRLHHHWTVFLGYRLEARMEVDDGGSVELQRYPVDAGVRFRWWFGAFELGARAGFGFAYSRLLQRLPASSANAVKSTTEWLVFASAYGYVGIRPIARLLLFGAVGARAYLVNAKYRLNGGDAVLSPWVVQPSFLLGLSVDIF